MLFASGHSTVTEVSSDSSILFWDISNKRLGIGTGSPGFSLTFSNGLGDKISFYTASGIHYGIAL